VECWECKTDLFVCLGDEGEGATADATSFENFGNYFRAFWRSYFDWSDKHAFYWLDWDAFDWAESTRYFPGGPTKFTCNVDEIHGTRRNYFAKSQ